MKKPTSAEGSAQEKTIQETLRDETNEMILEMETRAGIPHGAPEPTLEKAMKRFREVCVALSRKNEKQNSV